MNKLITVVILMFLASCQTQQPQNVNARPDMKELINDSETVLVDVRVPEQFEKNTAKGAINIPLAEIEEHATELKGKKVVLFCNTGRQAGQALDILKKVGHDNVYSGVSVFNIQALHKESNDK